MENNIVSKIESDTVSSKNLKTLPKYSAAEISYCLNLVESGDYVYLDTATQSKCEVVVTHYRANEAVYLDVIWITSLIAISILYVAVRAFYKVYNNYF